MTSVASKHAGPAKEARDVDQHVLIQRLHFRGMALGKLCVLFDLVNLVNHHAPLDAPQDGCLPVMREVHSRSSSQNLENGAEPHDGVGSRFHRMARMVLASNIRMTRDPRQFLGDAFGRKHVIHIARNNSASRHAVILGGGFVLRKSYAAVRLNFRHSQSSVRARSRQE